MHDSTKFVIRAVTSPIIILSLIFLVFATAKAQTTPPEKEKSLVLVTVIEVSENLQSNSNAALARMVDEMLEAGCENNKVTFNNSSVDGTRVLIITMTCVEWETKGETT